MTDQPTPRPWAVSYNGEIIPADHVNRRIGGSANPERDRDCYAQIIFRASEDRHGRGTAKANAALIVRAVNAHDDLVSAVKGLIGLTEIVASRDDILPSLVDALKGSHRVEEARAALAAATETTP